MVPAREWQGGAVSAALRCELFAADLWVAVGFYIEVLGFTVMRDERDAATPYVAVARGGVRLGLVQRPDVTDRGQRRPPVGVELVLEVPDVRVERDQSCRPGGRCWRT